jgi:hypothetical protein
MVYRLDSYKDVGPAVSLLRYAKGDRRLMDYAPVHGAQLSA